MPKGAALPEQSDKELAAAALKLQEKSPLYSEGAICGQLKRGREFLADRAKSSEVIAETRGIMSAIRSAAWEQKGIDGMEKGKDFNAVSYIWMTRNVLGWRNDLAERDRGRSSAGSPDALSETEKTLAGQLAAIAAEKP